MSSMFRHVLRSCVRIGFGPGLRSYVSQHIHRSTRVMQKVLTLRPEMLTKVGQNVLDLSNMKAPKLGTVNSALTTVPYSRTPSSANVPFPENTRGVFYFYQPPKESGAPGQLRFRLCDTIDAFHEGHDLKNEHGDAWCAVRLLKHKYSSSWRQLVIDEGLAHPHAFPQPLKLCTLRPEKMHEVGQEMFLLAGSKRWTIRFQDPKHQMLITYTSRYRRHDFPPDARGVLYYYQDPNLPAIAGQVRFRICESPAQFSEGRDLLTPDGECWHISLYRLARKGKVFGMYKGIREVLLQDGLVDMGLLNDIEQHPVPRVILPGNDLYALHQPFEINLAHRSKVMYVSTRHTREAVKLPGYFVDFRGCIATRPYTGKVLAHLETLRRGQVPKIVLRVLEILEPIHCVIKGYDAYIPPPVVGELAHRANRPHSKYIPVTTKNAALRRLALAEAD